MAHTICTFSACARKHYGHGLCSGHWQQRRKGKILTTLTARSITPEQRFWNKVEKTDGCWLWTGAHNGNGYGQIGAGANRVSAHVYSYEVHVGEIPNSMELDHTCHTPSCVRPDHLRLTTHKQNGEHRKGPRRDSTTGVRGVIFDKERQKFMARVVHNGTTLQLGRFDSIEAADAAVRAKRAELFTHDDAQY